MQSDRAPKTGWPAGLMQDDCRKLFEWFASRIDARWVLREVCRSIRAAMDGEKGAM